MKEKEIVLDKTKILPPEDFAYGKPMKYYIQKAIYTDQESNFTWICSRR